MSKQKHTFYSVNPIQLNLPFEKLSDSSETCREAVSEKLFSSDLIWLGGKYKGLKMSETPNNEKF
jgi:hypothetical protein